MKVLMFGWEFPPHISGGLGTACYGLTKGLSKKGVEITFVLPYSPEDSDGIGDRPLLSLCDPDADEPASGCGHLHGPGRIGVIVHFIGRDSCAGQGGLRNRREGLAAVEPQPGRKSGG